MASRLLSPDVPLIVREGDYGNSAFVVLEGVVRVIIRFPCIISRPLIIALAGMSVR